MEIGVKNWEFRKWKEASESHPNYMGFVFKYQEGHRQQYWIYESYSVHGNVWTIWLETKHTMYCNWKIILMHGH